MYRKAGRGAHFLTAGGKQPHRRRAPLRAHYVAPYPPSEYGRIFNRKVEEVEKVKEKE
jgi:hypothetical protein